MPPKVSPLAVATDALPLPSASPTSLHPKLIWLFGPSGSGKTHYIRTRYPGAFCKSADSNWKGYASHPVVAIEGFNVTARKLFQLTFVQWLTSDYIPVYVKSYKKRCIRPSLFIVTSYHHPTDFHHLKPFLKSILVNCEILHCTYIAPPPPPVSSITVQSDFSDDLSDVEYPLTPPSDSDDSQINYV